MSKKPPLDSAEVGRLIKFHQAGLDQFRQHISPSAQYMEERTVEALTKLKVAMEDEAKKKRK